MGLVASFSSVNNFHVKTPTSNEFNLLPTLPVHTKYDAISFLHQPLNKKKQRPGTQWDVEWSYLQWASCLCTSIHVNLPRREKRHVIISWKSPGIRTLLSGKTQPLTTFFLAGSQMWKTSSHTLVKLYWSFMKSSIWAKRTCPAKRCVSYFLDDQTHAYFNEPSSLLGLWQLMFYLQNHSRNRPQLC